MARKKRSDTIRRERREYQQAYRARKREEQAQSGTVDADDTRQVNQPELTDPISALSTWATEKLKVPYGHPLEGQPMTLPAYAESFLREAIVSRESLLSTGRKNSKTGITSVLCLGFLKGPLARPGFRAAVVSISKEKAAELKDQVTAIAEMSKLEGIRTYRSPAPGRIVSETGTLDVLSADKHAGHASGYDLVLIDELGLMPEKNRALINGLRSSVSAKNGKMICLSIIGDSPFTREMIDRKDNPGTCVHIHAADPDANINDRAQWEKANPGLLCGIKSYEYMEDEVRRLSASPGDESYFKSFDLNMPQSPDREMILSLDNWKSLCTAQSAPLGEAVMGFDAGGSSSMTAAAVLWPASGALRVFGAFGSVPDLKERGLADGVGNRYQRMAEAGELKVMGGRTTDVPAFLHWVLSTCPDVSVMAGDRYRQADIQDALSEAQIHIPVIWRGEGWKDGAEGVRSFQELALNGKINAGNTLMLESAIAESSVIRDAAGNPKLNKARQRGRIDALSATCHAAYLGKRSMARQSSDVYAGAVG